MVVALAREEFGDGASTTPESEQPEDERRPRLNVARGSADPGELDRLSILVAEDDDALRSTLAEILGAAGFNVTTVEDGQATLEKLDTEPVNILLLDLHMPRVDGITVLDRISAPPPVVVVHSAFEYYSPRELERKSGAKVFRYLRKPVAPPELMSTIEQAVAELRRIESD